MKILIVDDEQNILKTTAVALETMGHQPSTAINRSQAIRQMSEDRFDAVFLDLMLGNENGLDVLDEIVAVQSAVPVIVFTAYSSIESAVNSMRKGAFDYVQKPFVPEQIRQVLQKVESTRKLQSKVKELESQLADVNPIINLESQEDGVQKIYNMALQAAKSEANILVLGPSGTGKTVLARNIHARSSRSSKAFVTVHCPSLSKELLESELFGHVKGAFTGAVKETWGKVAVADEGTLFLDEIGEIPPPLQAKLLRLLQDREYERVGETRTRKADVRVIAATNRNLETEVREGTFREDLFYRLNVVSLTLPPLSERPRDVLPLATNYLNFFARRMGKGEVVFDEEVTRAFIEYSWPGNLRELKNVVERSLIFCESNTVTMDHLPEAFHDREESAIRPGYEVSLRELEEEHIRRILARETNMERAAETLGIDTATLYRKRKKLGLLK